MQYLTILGSTGSIGLSTLDVVERNPDRFAVVALPHARELTSCLGSAANSGPDTLL